MIITDLFDVLNQNMIELTFGHVVNVHVNLGSVFFRHVDSEFSLDAVEL